MEVGQDIRNVDGIAAEALAAVLGVDADVLNSLTEHEEIEDATGDSGAIIAVPDDFNVVFELATKMNLKEVRVAERPRGAERRRSAWRSRPSARLHPSASLWPLCAAL